ncbi:hypothetical protein MTCOM_23690 [Moorella thermoacetica]|uniref:copper amine oxidase N-terminal domain-containing protein n=1 Tax=Neomoorella thermoacetica TaxID=1525 RepID=UPI0030CC21E6
MLKTRKKWISILLTLAMLVGLMVPLAAPAGAVGTVYTSLEVPTVDDNDYYKLGKFQIEIDPVYVNVYNYHEAYVDLPGDFEIKEISIANSGSVDVTDPTFDGTIEATATATGGSKSGDVGDVKVIASNFSDKGFKIKIERDTADIEGAKLRIPISFDWVKVPSGVSGDIQVTITNITGQLTDGKVVIARVGEGGLKVSAIKTNSFSDAGGTVKIRVEETIAGKLSKSDKLKIELPNGFKWDSEVTEFDKVWGDIDNSKLASTLSNSGKTLEIWYEGTTTNQRSAFEFKAKINVDDPDEAKMGDVIAKLKGGYTVSPSELVVGTYGDYDITIEAEDPEVVAYAGMNDQDVSNIKIKEVLANTIVNNRTLTLTLPENARWVRINDLKVNPEGGDYSQLATNSDIDKDGPVTLKFAGLQGTNNRTAKFVFKVDEGTTSWDDELEFTIEDLGVALKGGVTGDLKVTVGGSQGISGEITIAKVVAPISVKADKTNVQIGKAAQEAGNIVITEAAAEAIDYEGTLTVTLPKDIEFNGTPDVKVTKGDLKIDDVNVIDGKGRNDVLEITFKSESSEASTIEISNIKYDINRVLGEGDIEVKIGGTAVVNTDVEGYYDAKANAWDSDGFWPGTDYAAKVVNAVCVTPAPGGAKYSASFVIGSTTYTVNGVQNTMDVAPYVKNDRTYLPVRYVAYALGITPENILWDGKTATFIGEGRVVQVTPGSAVMTINGAPVTMDVTTDLVNGRVMVPFRWIAQAFGAQVNYDEATQTVSIN